MPVLQSIVYVATSAALSWMSGGSRSEIFLSSGISCVASWQFKNLGGITSLVVICLYNIVKLNTTKSKIVHPNSSDISDPIRKKLAKTVEEIVRRTESLSNPKYVPTFWAANTWPNVVLLMMKQRFDIAFRNNFTRDQLTMEDGGTVSVDWPVEAANLPEDAPIVIFLHTITGSSRYTSEYTR